MHDRVRVHDPRTPLSRTSPIPDLTSPSLDRDIKVKMSFSAVLNSNLSHPVLIQEASDLECHLSTSFQL